MSTTPAGRKEISIIIPAFNEAKAIREVIDDVHESLKSSGWTYEIIVVDDASKDNTAELARQAGVRVIAHPENVGYGGALRTGIEKASYEWLGTIDSDRSYPAMEFLKLLPFAETHDMVVGARKGKHYWGTFLKYPARLVFLALAQFVVGRKIPDVNSGIRIFKRSIVMGMIPRLCKGFSFSTTLTLSFLSNFHFVRFVPVEYLPRVGKSKVRYFRDTLRTLQLMLETIVFYNPMKAGVLLMLFPLISGIVCFCLSAVTFNFELFSLALNLLSWSLLFLGVGFVLFLISQLIHQLGKEHC